MSSHQLAELYDRFAAGLFRYARQIVGEEHAAKDVLQEVFVRLARSDHQPSSSEQAWVYRIAHNVAVDHLRRREVRSRPVEQETVQQAGNADGETVGLWVTRALTELPAEQRSVAELRLLQEMTFEEIATVQGIPLNTAASRYRYAIDKLRTLLRPIYDELK